MTPDLSHTARALLDAARDGLGPDAAALRRVRGKLDAAVSGGIAAGSALALKLTLVIGVAAIVAAGALALRSNDQAAPPSLTFTSSPATETHEQRARDDRAPVMHIEMPAQRSSPPIATPPMPPRTTALASPPATAPPPMSASSSSQAPSSQAPSSQAPSSSPSSSPSSARAQSESTSGSRCVDLAREVELVDAAMASLRKGNPTAALAAVRLHRAETNNRGQLAEDAAAIEIEALCRLHDRRVVAKLEAFDARWPESAQRSRLTTSCP